MNQTLFKNLLDKYLTENITIDEKQQLTSLLEHPEYELELVSILTNEFKAHTYEGEEDAKIRALIQAHISHKINSDGEVQPLSGERLYKIPLHQKYFALPRVAAAAAVTLLLATTAYFILSNRPEKKIVKTNDPVPAQTDILPGSNKALLTLAGGKTIELGNARNGALAQQGNMTIIKADSGRLLYSSAKPGENPASELSYNTLSTPAGGQYQLTLPDGTKVWLNAASSIHYPTAFSGPERSVELKGEAYFEVAKDKTKPFKVKINTPLGDEGEVKVLGTNFNINAYGDEPTLKTTLLEGAVLVTQQNTGKRLYPGQQAVINTSTHVITIAATDPSLAVAWKNGVFEFESAGIETIMRQLQRWYGIEVAYEFKTTETFGASIQRKEPLSRTLKLLETTGHVHFKIEGRKVTVMK